MNLWQLRCLLFSVCLNLALGVSAQAPKPTSGFIKTPDGLKIHYLDTGLPPDRRPTYPPTLPGKLPLDPTPTANILFVPGWTMPGWIWEQQIAYFARTHRVVAMDPRSQGESSQTSEGHYPAARARDIKAVVDQLKLAPVVLVGWSMGVTEAAAYVDQFGTDTLAGLVLVDGWAGADYDPQVTPQMWQWAAGFQKNRQAQTEAFIRSMYKKPQSEEYLKRVTQASLRTPTNSAVALFVGAFTSDYRPALARINKPTLLVVAQSRWVTAYQDMQKRIPGSRMEVLENVGHALFVDDADRFNSLLEDFVKGLR
jgi:microsomal epoxide hydrolase